MTPQEAIDILINLEHSLDEYSGLNETGKTAFRMAVEALKKQIPKKPEMVLDKWKCAYSLFCPTCKSYLGVKGVHSIYIGEKPSHCTCGQKLNWRLGRYSEGRKDDTTNSD